MVHGSICDAKDVTFDAQIRGCAHWSDGDTPTFKIGNPQTSPVIRGALSVTAISAINSTCTDCVVIASTTDTSSVSVSVSAPPAASTSTTPTATGINAETTAVTVTFLATNTAPTSPSSSVAGEVICEVAEELSGYGPDTDSSAAPRRSAILTIASI